MAAVEYVENKGRLEKKRKRWQHAIKCNIVFHYYMLLVSRQAGKFGLQNVESSLFLDFFFFFLPLSFILFYNNSSLLQEMTK
jgi:hypothetical protein